MIFITWVQYRINSIRMKQPNSPQMKFGWTRSYLLTSKYSPFQELAVHMKHDTNPNFMRYYGENPSNFTIPIRSTRAGIFTEIYDKINYACRYVSTKIHGSYGINFASKMSQVLDFNMIFMAPKVGTKKSNLPGFQMVGGT